MSLAKMREKNKVEFIVIDEYSEVNDSLFNSSTQKAGHVPKDDKNIGSY